MTDHPPLESLLQQLSDDGLSDEQFAALAALLEQDEEARADYLRWRDQEAQLYWDYSGAPLAARQAEALAPAEQAVAPAPAAANSILDRASRRPIPPSVTIALLTLAAIVLVMAFIPVSEYFQRADQPADIGPLSPSRAQVARLIRAVDARWTTATEFPGHGGYATTTDEPSGFVPRIGSRLSEGDRLYLASGVAEIYFDNGAEVVLEGPAVLEIESSAQGRLELGRLVGTCSTESALGFAIATPWGHVVDLGTEFGIAVAADGAMQVAVFDGQVAFHALPASSRPPRTLNAGDVLRLKADGAVDADAGQQPMRFVRRGNGRWTGLSGVVAGYRQDFIPGTRGNPTTARRWKYLWNAHGPIGDRENYAELVWSGNNAYTTDADKHPADPPGNYAHLGPAGGHPGLGSRQQNSDGIDRYVIAAYLVEQPGRYALTNTIVGLVRQQPQQTSSLRVRVFIDDEPPLVDATVATRRAGAFDVTLGELSPGQVIYVAIGPNGHAGNKAFQFDFNIVHSMAPD